MSRYSPTILEEELKNKVAANWFAAYDTTQIVGRIDFSVAYPRPTDPQLFDVETQFLLWAEAKGGTTHDIYESLTQLVLTIGKEGANREHLPPAFLGAFDAEKMLLIPYYKVMDLFSHPAINWKVTPSDHTSDTFKQMLALVKRLPDEAFYFFDYEKHERELQRFIKRNFVSGKKDISKIFIDRNNFTFVYQKWCKEVKPTIAIDWDAAKKEKVIDADFYLADLLSSNNVSFKEKLQVLLCSDEYRYNIHLKATGAWNSDTVDFKDGQKAHKLFWNRYNRPPKRDYWDYMVERRDLLVPEDVREREGSFFTPPQWVDLSQKYIAMELGDDWQNEYYVWDCCAGTGNLLYGLKNSYKVYASDISEANVKAMHDRIQNGANLLDAHVFQFDFLNDSFFDDKDAKSKLPKSLQEILRDEEKRKRLVIYINPPFAEAGNRKVIANGGEGTYKQKTNVAVSNLTYKRYLRKIGIAGRELFAQFLMRIYDEIPSAVLAQFSKLKIEQAPNFRDFRDTFRAKLGRNFIVPADTFDNVKGDFPIGFFIWHLDSEERFTETVTDVYDSKGICIGQKTLCAFDDMKSINDWIIETRKRNSTLTIGYMSCRSHDFSNVNYNFIMNDKSQMKSPRGSWVTDKNVREACVYIAVCHCIPATWLNDRDQFLYPNEGWARDYEFQTDCLVYTLFSNNIQSRYGVNHWIPFTEQEVGAQEAFKSHFMTDYFAGKLKSGGGAGGAMGMGNLFEGEKAAVPSPTAAWSPPPLTAAPTYVASEHFSTEARDVMDAGRELWRYYHQQPTANPDASFYDIRLHFQGKKVTASGREQMCPDSADEHYTQLITTLRQCLKQLAARIAPRVYDYGFLK